MSSKSYLKHHVRTSKGRRVLVQMYIFRSFGSIIIVDNRSRKATRLWNILLWTRSSDGVDFYMLLPSSGGIDNTFRWVESHIKCQSFETFSQLATYPSVESMASCAAVFPVPNFWVLQNKSSYINKPNTEYKLDVVVVASLMIPVRYCLLTQTTVMWCECYGDLTNELSKVNRCQLLIAVKNAIEVC